MKLKGKVAIITGSTTGIGNSIAKLFAKEGASVVINCHKDQECCERIAGEIKKGGGKALAVSADVSIKKEIDELIAKTVKEFGSVDIMVNNAGILDFSPLTEMKEEAWDKIMAVNLKGNFLGTQAAANQMIKQGNGGKIINLTSIAGLIGYATLAHYCSSKSGIIGLTRVAALELAQHKINVNAIAPGLIETPMTAGMMKDPKQKEGLLAGIPLKRAGQPEEIAAAALYLASSDSDYTTGHTMVVDGGWTVQ